ncbi:armadillo-type protein [Mycena leptocephala]|nr:armadillo-type protein [Mycena leptocephala]
MTGSLGPKLLLSWQSTSACVFEAIANQSDDNIQIIVDAYVVPALVALLSRPSLHPDILKSAIRVLGRLAELKFSNYLLRQDALPPLVSILSASSPNLATCAVSTLRKICCYYCLSREDLNTILSIIPALTSSIGSNDYDVHVDACWSISHLLHMTDPSFSGDVIQAVIASGVSELFPHLLRHSSSVRIPILRSIINLCAGTDDQTQSVVESGCIPVLCELVTSLSSERIQTYACRAISNIAASSSHIQALVDAVIIPELVVLATRSGPLKQEAVWTMCNVLGRSLDPHQMETLVQLGCICAMYEAALGNDISLARACLATFLEIKRRWNVHFGYTPQSWLPAAEIVEGFIGHEDEQIASIAFDLSSTLAPVIPPFMSRKEYTQPEPNRD